MGAAPAADCSGDRSPQVEDEAVGGGPRCWPPGFRFHPTDEELVLYYLKRKICGRRIRPRMIGDFDVYKWEPWELPEKSVLRSGDKQWYFFSPRDRKYPNGLRSNRATKHGYWKATGKDRTIMQDSKPAGNKKTLVYYHGRAPKGERTDWVMHEYTLDEQVLMSCTTVQDSFALYKLFRKSGPGPKNGEQYGAPFKEEEWEVDDVQDEYVGNQTNREDTPTEHLDNHSVDRSFVVNEEQSNMLPNYELENILLQMSSELDVIPGDPECNSYAPEPYSEVDGAGHIADPPTYKDATFPRLSGAWSEHGIEPISFETALPPSAAYVLPNTQTPEAVPLTSSSLQAQLEGIEEFLEIKDFNDSDSVVRNSNNIVNVDDIHMNNDLIDPDDYFDAQMFVAEAMGDGVSPDSYWADSGFNDTQFEASDLTTQLWTHEQVPVAPTPVELNQIGLASSSASSGFLYGSGSQTDPGGVIQENINYVSSPPESWFGSTLTAFLDSVPSRPALASENALINRALTRVSSFTTGRIQRDGGPIRRHGGQNGGFLFVSFLVGLGAVFWFLIIGVVLKVFKGFWGKFISS